MQFLCPMIFHPSFLLYHHTWWSIVSENVRPDQGYDSGSMVPKNLRPTISLHNFHILPFKQFVKHYHGKKHKHCKRHNYLLVFRSARTSFTTSAGSIRWSVRPHFITSMYMHCMILYISLYTGIYALWISRRPCRPTPWPPGTVNRNQEWTRGRF